MGCYPMTPSLKCSEVCKPKPALGFLLVYTMPQKHACFAAREHCSHGTRNLDCGHQTYQTMAASASQGSVQSIVLFYYHIVQSAFQDLPVGLLTPLLKQKLQGLGAQGRMQTERTAAKAAMCCLQQMLPNPPSALPCQSSALMHGKELACRPWERKMGGFLGTKC